MHRKIALKVDCDTFEGTKNGLPNLLRLFEKVGIKASFFFTLGPDRSGRAVRRLFTQKGFLRKMFRSKAVSWYGPKTILYGTLLPSPQIGQQCKSVIRSVGEAGHEVGVHGWDHVGWHDFLDRMSESQILNEVGQAHQLFEEIFGKKAHSSAAPGWHATPRSLAVQERFGLLYTSDTRLGPPFFPRSGNRLFSFLEIPTTLPTWDEVLGDPKYKDQKSVLGFYQDAIQGTEVHTIHTEVEGIAHLSLFEKQLTVWKGMGVSFVTLEEMARETLRKKESIPQREIIRIRIPCRGGLVSSGEG